MEKQTKQNDMPGDMELMRQQSDYLKRVADFARYMQGEYIEGSDERSLFIVASDRDVKELGKMADAAIVIDPKHLHVLALAEQMSSNEGFAELMSEARAFSLRDDTDLPVLERIATERSRRRKCIAMLSFIGVYCTFLMVLDIVLIRGLLNTLSLVSNLLLMSFLAWLVVRDLRDHNRHLERLEGELQNDRKNHMMVYVNKAMFNIIKKFRQQSDNDE